MLSTNRLLVNKAIESRRRYSTFTRYNPYPLIFRNPCLSSTYVLYRNSFAHILSSNPCAPVCTPVSLRRVALFLSSSPSFSVGVPDLFPSPPFLSDLIASFYAPRARIYIHAYAQLSRIPGLC